jgi:hypothetical protein
MVISPVLFTRDAFHENNLGQRKSRQEDRLKRNHELEFDGTGSKKKRPKPIDLAALNSSRTAPSIGSGSTNGYSQCHQNSPFSYPVSSRSTFTDISDVTSPITESEDCHTEKCAEQVEPRIHLTHNQLSAALEFQFWELGSMDCIFKPDQPDSLDFLNEEAINHHSVTRPVLMIDYISPTEQYTWPNILTIKKAADFFLSSSILEDSFNLNLLIWKQLQNPWYPQYLSTYTNVDPLLEWNTLLSCARSATGSSHLTIVRLLLEQRLSAMKDKKQEDENSKEDLQKTLANLDTQRFLLNMLLAEICQRQGEIKNGNRFMQTASSSLPEVSQLSSVYIHQVEPANMGFYYYLIRGYAHRIFMAGQTVDRTTTRQLSLTLDDPLIGMAESLGRDLEELQQIFLAQPSGLFSLCNGQMQNRCIKNALHWCRMQLNDATTSPSSSEPLEYDAQKSNWTMQYRIYKFLWERWRLEIKNESGLLAKLTSKIEESGISFAELLDLICSTLMSDLPAASKASLWINSRHGVGPDLELFKKAAALVDRLVRTSDMELADKLCSRFLLRHRERHCDWEDLDLKTKTQGDAIRLVEETLDLHIPKNPISESSQQSAPSDVLNDNEHRSSNLFSSGPSGRYDPTLAPSYSSSERSSMQRLSMRIMEARHSKRSSTSMAPSRATRLAYSNMYNKRPPSDELSDSMSSMNLSKERWSRFSTSSRTDAFSVVEDLVRHVGLERLGAVSEGDE